MIREDILTNWWCATCRAVTPGGRPDPRPCCTKPFVFRWTAVWSEPDIEDEAA